MEAVEHVQPAQLFDFLLGHIPVFALKMIIMGLPIPDFAFSALP